MNINSNDLNVAMLKAGLSGNEIKVILAYISKGGWKHGTEVFLPESVKKEYHLSDSTVKRIRKSLIEKGWMIPTGNKSQWGCDKYLITIPAPVEGGSNCTTPQVNLNPGVGQNDTRGGSEWSTEVTKEVTKESNLEVTKVKALRVYDAQTSASASVDSDRIDRIKRIKDRYSAASAAAPVHPIDLNGYSFSESLILNDYRGPVLNEATEETRVVQNDLPLEGVSNCDTCPECGEGDFEVVCFPCGFVGVS